MRSYDCFLHFYHNKEKVEFTISQCFRGLKECKIGEIWYYSTEELLPFIDDRCVYISEFIEPKTIQHIPKLIELVNEITPCEVSGDYIKYKLIGSYNNDLIILNFIRNLWHEPIIGYTKVFFENIYSEEYKDPLAILLNANKLASKEYYKLATGHHPLTLKYGVGHSNVKAYDLLRVRTTQELLDWRGEETFDFLCPEAA